MRMTISICVLLVLAIMLVGPSQPVQSGSHMQSVSSTASISVLPGSTDLIVEVIGSDVFDEVSAIVTGTGSIITFSSRDTGILSFTAAEDAESVAETLSLIPGVVSVSSEMRASTSFVPNDSGLEYQWGLDTIDAYEAWDITLGTEDTIIAVLDTGIDWNHPDLTANIWTNAQGYHGYNFIDDNWFPMDDNINGYDENGDYLSNIYTYHGTHVAGIMGATIDNALGIAGIAQVKLMAVKVMNDSGEGTDSTVSSGVRWAVDNGAHVIVMSLGLDGLSTPLQNAVNYATSRGVVLVASAGNSGTSVLSYPAAFPNVIAVGASDNLDRRASFSNFGLNLDIMAPGVGIYSTQGGGSYQSLSGTSAAAPHVAAVAALMLTLNPALTTTEVGDIINSTATDISRVGYDTSTGWGIVNAFRAVESVADPTVTITEFPEQVDLNATISVSWMVSGGDPGDIESTYLTWGYSETELVYQSDIFSGTTWAEFSVTNIPSLPTNGTVYLKAYAVVDGLECESDIEMVSVTESIADNLFMQFFKDIQNFIFNDLGLINFLLLMCVLIAIPVIVVAARPKKRKVQAQTIATAPAPGKLDHYQPVTGVHHLPPPPPPPPRFEAYVDIVGNNIVPEVVKVVEGTKVIWVNRTWAAPPGVGIRSGGFDSSGEHPDGLFQSGLLIAPGDYWSCTFHRSGVYQYYLTAVWGKAKIVVEPYKSSNSQSSKSGEPATHTKSPVSR